MNNNSPDRLTSIQFGMLVWTAMLSPLLRTAPGAMLARAGRAVWLSPLLGAVSLTGLSFFLSRLLAKRRAGEGLGELVCRALGVKAGRCALFLLTLWLCFAGGYVLRAGADRFAAAVYPESPVWLFMAVMLLIILPAGLGELKALGRAARITAPVLGAVFLLVFLASLPGLDKNSLLPLPDHALGRGGLGALALVGGTAHMAAFAFLTDRVEEKRLFRVFFPVAMAVSALALILTLATVGTFGPALCGRMDYPFFVLLRNLRLFPGGERVEALVAALWVVSDYLLLGALLHMAAGALALALRGPGAGRPAWAVWICAGAMGALGLVCVPRAFALAVYARRVMPICGGALVYGVLPLVWIIGKLRKKI